MDGLDKVNLCWWPILELSKLSATMRFTIDSGALGMWLGKFVWCGIGFLVSG